MHVVIFEHYAKVQLYLYTYSMNLVYMHTPTFKWLDVDEVPERYIESAHEHNLKRASKHARARAREKEFAPTKRERRVGRARM